MKAVLSFGANGINSGDEWDKQAMPGDNNVAIVNSSFLSTDLMCAIVVLTGCGDGKDPATELVEMPDFNEDLLMQGRGVWMQTCRACHLKGVGGAPAVTDSAQWDVRLPKGRDALARSVINGIADESGSNRMPPRGGNPRLTDRQIQLAVDYKMAAIEALRERSTTQISAHSD